MLNPCFHLNVRKNIEWYHFFHIFDWFLVSKKSTRLAETVISFDFFFFLPKFVT